VGCGLVMLLGMIVVQHGGGWGDSAVNSEMQSEDKYIDKSKNDNHVDIQSEINKMHKYVHSLKLTKKKVEELSGNQTLDKFLRRGARLKQKLLDIILNEENKKPEPKKDKTNSLKTMTIIYNRINKSGSTSLLGKIGLNLINFKFLLF
jgi:hypothetical protein